jgi:hypothetical protein
VDGDYEESELEKANVLVKELDGATIVLNGSPESLKLSKLNNCKLICKQSVSSLTYFRSK